MRTRILGITILGFCLLPICVFGQKIDFEFYPVWTPGGTETQELDYIHDQWAGAPYFVEFWVGEPWEDKYPVIAKVGGVYPVAFPGPNREDACFSGITTTNDMPVPNQGVGCSFITDDDGQFQTKLDLSIRYLRPARRASGEILDIDQTEGFTITAYYAIGPDDYEAYDPPVTLDPSTEGAGDGLATPWMIEPGGDIDLIIISYSGNPEIGAGLAFDNFYPFWAPVEDEFTYQEEYYLPEDSPFTAYDLTMLFYIGPTWYQHLGFEEIITGFPFTSYMIDSLPEGITAIHWDSGTAAPGDTVQAGFSPIIPELEWDPWSVKGAFWTDEQGNNLGPAAPVVNVTPIFPGNVPGIMWIKISNECMTWNGGGWPIQPGDGFGSPVEPIIGTELYWAVTDIARPMEELNSDLNTDPSITWHALGGFTLNYGETANYQLGSGFDSTDVLLVRYKLAGAGLTASNILQAPVHVIEQVPVGGNIPTLSMWGIAILCFLLLVLGRIMIVRRRRA